MAFAVVLQNCMHPKNAQRAEAVKAGTYVEVNSISIGGQVNTVSSRQNGEREAGDQKK